jgi:diguanylate cyclase (GGDEF)-like protein
MANSDVSKLLLSLAKLIEKPEIKAFQISIIQTLSNIIVADSINLYEIRTLKQLSMDHPQVFLVRVGYEDRFEDALPEPMLLQDQPQYIEAKDSDQIVIRQISDDADPTYRSIFPISGAKSVNGFLTVESKQLSQQNQELVSIFIGFYRNYLALLNDNQRDHLSGLLNRKSFDDKMMQIIISLGEGNKRDVDKVQYCLALFDIDRFKRVNDTFGHLVGDEVLLHFSQCMTETFREYDLLFRVGGEEFVAVLRNVSMELAQLIMERFRKVVEAHYFPQVGNVTVSIGATFINPSDLSVTIMDRADKALYYAKENGRNQTVFYEHLIEAGKLQATTMNTDVDLF